MAKNGKAYVNEIVANKKNQKPPKDLSSNLLTEDELLEQFAKLIIDIYLDQKHEKEKHHPESST
jgi:hypothetical protein